MSIINYGTSDYITIGLEPYNPDDYRLYDESTGDFIIDYDCINADCEEDYNNIKFILNQYDFYYYHVEIKPGYYEGFYIDIENNFRFYYDSSVEKQEALRELTQLRKFLIECVNNGLCKCNPGWCTTYYDRAESIEIIKEVIKQAKAECKRIPTYLQLIRKGEAV